MGFRDICKNSTLGRHTPSKINNNRSVRRIYYFSPYQASSCKGSIRERERALPSATTCQSIRAANSVNVYISVCFGVYAFSYPLYVVERRSPTLPLSNLQTNCKVVRTIRPEIICECRDAYNTKTTQLGC